MSAEGPRQPDRFPYYLSASLQVLRWIFWLVALYIGLDGLEPLLALIAGQETIFNFDAAFSISVAINVAGVAAVVTAMRRNKQLNERVRSLEERLPPERPQREQLPLPPGDGA